MTNGGGHPAEETKRPTEGATTEETPQPAGTEDARAE